MQQMHVYGVSFDLVGKQPIVLLKTVEGNRFLPIWIGHPEAAAILMKLQNAATPRPMTHDLVTDILGELGAKVVQVAVTELRENTFYAQRHDAAGRLGDRGRLAPLRRDRARRRAEAPIFVADEVIDESAIEFEGEEISDEALEKRGDEVPFVPRERHARTSSPAAKSRTRKPRASSGRGPACRTRAGLPPTAGRGSRAAGS